MPGCPPISTRTRLCAVIGDPIAHSLSPALHNAAFEACGLDFVYVSFRVTDTQNALTGMRALENFRGMSVTIPHKVDAMNWVDDIPEVDKAIGAINTIINEDGKLVGLNTDGPGALKALVDAGVDMQDKRVLMLGCGGAARAIAFTLAWDNRMADLTLLDVDAAMMKSLAADLAAGTQAAISAHPSTEETMAAAMAQADIVIHCTPIGMHPHEDASLVPPELFREGQVVFDIVYTPLETKLLKEAKAKGLQTISGVEMFVNQAVLQFERFTGAQAPVEVMRQVVLEHLTS